MSSTSINILEIQNVIRKMLALEDKLFLALKHKEGLLSGQSTGLGEERPVFTSQTFPGFTSQAFQFLGKSLNFSVIQFLIYKMRVIFLCYTVDFGKMNTLRIWTYLDTSHDSGRDHAGEDPTIA